MRAPVRCGPSGAARQVRACVPEIVGWGAPGAVAGIAVRTTVKSEWSPLGAAHRMESNRWTMLGIVHHS